MLPSHDFTNAIWIWPSRIRPEPTLRPLAKMPKFRPRLARLRVSRPRHRAAQRRRARTPAAVLARRVRRNDPSPMLRLADDWPYALPDRARRNLHRWRRRARVRAYRGRTRRPSDPMRMGVASSASAWTP